MLLGQKRKLSFFSNPIRLQNEAVWMAAQTTKGGGKGAGGDSLLWLSLY